MGENPASRIYVRNKVRACHEMGIRSSPISGQNAVVVGASTIVGKPMALMLLAREATVAVCHIKTRDLAQFTLLADILIAAGRPNLITAPMVKNGAVVIDVGINRLPDG